MNKDGQLDEKSTIEEVKRSFIRNKKVFDDLCIAYQNMTWEEYTRMIHKEDKPCDRE